MCVGIPVVVRGGAAGVIVCIFVGVRVGVIVGVARVARVVLVFLVALAGLVSSH